MAALSTEGASGFGSSVADEGLTNVVKIVPEFNPEKEVTYDDLQLFTNNFSGENWIVRTQFGMLYRGKIPRSWRGIPEEKDVTVKVWESWCYLTNGDTYHVKPENLLARVKINLDGAIGSR
ncbi:hypothetical protein CDL12_13433 [Handroanthus impetiginosus]|uniref:Uncharacterized protein n=1 Tax=Handroanthus impetiginosus TaxID=429701 RepID=A0A2G9H8V3_9LAMI|nr:hypothetical protein CDL12_13433 [Handroanthus impetiginosus]